MLIPEININIELFLQEFVDEEIHILEIDINEATISSQIKSKLERTLSGWDVNCEYNRNASQVKRLIYAVTPDGSVKERNVVPDIIVHQRETAITYWL